MPELSVSRKTIGKLFSDMKNSKFIIPDYQRPYKWDVEKCDILWNDIINHFHDNLENNTEKEYFLGTVVTCHNENQKGNIELIDGQQRVTSFSLLLRAFYKKLENMKEDDKTVGLKSQIAPCLWDVNPISKKVEDMSKLHIVSNVATESDNEVFHGILRTGDFNDKAKDRYSLNYKYFYEKCEEYATNNPIQWLSLCVSILDTCIVLPIECDNIDIALTIFSTLNDRGMPLSDADIFKAQIYRNKNSEDERNQFSTDWKELSEIAEDAGMEVNEVFRFYSHYLRGKSNDRSKEIGLRKYYAKDNFEKLKSDNLINDLTELAQFWYDIYDGELKNNKITIEARKYIHCLECYPNEYWKYVLSVYFFKNRTKNSFDSDFVSMLKKLTSFLLVKFVQKPTVNAIKDDIYLACCDIMQTGVLHFSLQLEETFKTSLLLSTNFKTAKSLILLNAYLNNKQEKLIPSQFEIEHIFPRVWQQANYNGWDKSDADIYLEKFGNKAPIEKKINIQAGNGYFGKKKSKYSFSEIAEINQLSNYKSNDWTKEDIELRDKAFADNLFDFFTTNLK